MDSIYDNKDFFDQYAQMSRSREGLAGAGEWHELKQLFPALSGKSVLDLGCGYGWHSKYAVEQGAVQVVGLDLSECMIAEAKDATVMKELHTGYADLRSTIIRKAPGIS